MVKTAVMVLGVVFTLIGILGFFDTFTNEQGELLGIFAVDNTHNVIHLLSGLAAILAASTSYKAARTYAQVFGVVYALVTILGFAQGDGELLDLFTINDADNWLHLVLAAALLYLGFGPADDATRRGGTRGAARDAA